MVVYDIEIEIEIDTDATYHSITIDRCAAHVLADVNQREIVIVQTHSFASLAHTHIHNTYNKLTKTYKRHQSFLPTDD